MSELMIGFMAIGLMLVAIVVGMHIGVALIVTSFLSVWLLKSPEIAARFVGAAANDAIRDYLFGVVPLFVLMGMFVSVSGVGRDTFDVFQWLLRRLRGGLGLATVGANAVFAAITGISIASASVFTKVAVPEMIRHGYTPRFSVGVVAGSSVLGMLIPPSLLMILYGFLANQSVGDLFTAGIVPGLLLAAAFAIGIVLAAYFKPSMVYAGGEMPVPDGDAGSERSASGWWESLGEVMAGRRRPEEGERPACGKRPTLTPASVQTFAPLRPVPNSGAFIYYECDGARSSGPGTAASCGKPSTCVHPARPLPRRHRHPASKGFPIAVERSPRAFGAQHRSVGPGSRREFARQPE